MLSSIFGFLSCCSKEKPSGSTTLNNISIDISRTSSQIQLHNMKKRKSTRPRLQDFSSYYDNGIDIFSNNASIHNPLFHENYPRNEVIIMGRSNKIIAKIIQRKITEAMEPGKGLGISRLEIISRGSNPIDSSASPVCFSSFEEKLSEKSSEDISIEKKKEIFSLYNKGVQVERWHERVPENVARHIGYRLRCDVIIDAFCEYGENAIQVIILFSKMS